MRNQKFEPSTGDRVTSPAGRLLRVADVFVPRNNIEKSKAVPSRFRNLSRKIVIFDNGSVAPLREIQERYQHIA